MIHIEKTFSGKDSVAIRAMGRLDEEGLSTLRVTCLQALEGNVRVSLHLDDLISIDRKGKEYLREIQDRITLVGLPEYLKLELSD